MQKNVYCFYSILICFDFLLCNVVFSAAYTLLVRCIFIKCLGANKTSCRTSRLGHIQEGSRKGGGASAAFHYSCISDVSCCLGNMKWKSCFLISKSRGSHVSYSFNSELIIQKKGCSHLPKPLNSFFEKRQTKKLEQP